MRRANAAAGSVAFFMLAPGVIAGLVPWWLTGWDLLEPLPYWAPLRILGLALILIGIASLVQAFARFVFEGLGTPAPIAPPERLIVAGAYRYVRNPMYIAVLAIIVGQALLLGRPALILYAAAVLGAFAAFVRLYEEPMLRRRFGPAYENYRRAVPAWWPRRPRP